jgi:hypothetical protein
MTPEMLYLDLKSPSISLKADEGDARERNSKNIAHKSLFWK